MSARVRYWLRYPLAWCFGTLAIGINEVNTRLVKAEDWAWQTASRIEGDVP